MSNPSITVFHLALTLTLFPFLASAGTALQNRLGAANFTEEVTAIKTVQVVPYQETVGRVRLVFDDEFAYLATPDGLFRTSRSLNANSSRTLIGFAGQPIYNLYVRDNVLYVLKEGGDVRSNSIDVHSFLKSTDHGQTFVPLDNGLSWCLSNSCWYLPATQAFFKDSLIFLAAGHGSNFFVSPDEGKTWKVLNGSREPQLCSDAAFELIGNKVLFGGECPLDSAYLSVGTLREDMLDWTSSGQPRQVMGLQELENRNVQFIAHSPNTPFALAGVEGGLLKTYDLGEMYQFKLKYPFDNGSELYPYIQHALLSTSYRDLFFVAGFNKARVTGYLAYSRDHGETWTNLSNLILPPNYSTAGVGFLTQDPQGRILAGLFNANARELIIAEVTISAPVVLLTEDDQDRALALDSVTLQGDPFSLSNDHNFSSDRRTRISLFATNILPPDQNASAITARAEDFTHKLYELPVEFVTKVPNYSWLTQIVVRLPDDIANAGDVHINIAVRGVESNKPVINIR
jgi:hypothetical protein